MRHKGIILLPTQAHTCCCINGKESFGVSRDETIRNLLIEASIVIGCIELNNFSSGWAILRHRWIVNRLLG